MSNTSAVSFVVQDCSTSDGSSLMVVQDCSTRFDRQQITSINGMNMSTSSTIKYHDPSGLPLLPFLCAHIIFNSISASLTDITSCRFVSLVLPWTLAFLMNMPAASAWRKQRRCESFHMSHRNRVCLQQATPRHHPNLPQHQAIRRCKEGGLHMF
jgi:hypothetical protein